MKQSRRIKILLIVFILTGIGASMVLLKNTRWESDSAASKPLVVDSSTLQKVTMVYQGRTTLLTKSGINWKVNNQFNARANLIQLMYVGLLKSEFKRPIAAENKPKIIALLQKEGIKVTVEDALTKSTFFIAPNENDANSSYYMSDNGTEPIIIYVPGFSGDMVNLFKMDEANWRSKIVFASTPNSLQKITLTYPSLPKNNVSIKWNTDQTFEIEGIKTVDTSKVMTYLAQFEQIAIDQYVYVNKDLIISDLSKIKPQAIIDVADLQTLGSRTLSIYAESKEPKGIYAIVKPENDLVVVKPETLFRILVRKEFFEKKK